MSRTSNAARTVRYFEDYPPGAVFEFGDRVITEAEILRFGREFDPQPFHVDKDEAARSIYGGLIASGWHTAAMMMRMVVDEFLSPETSLGSPGVDELRWLLPVRPGDRLRMRITVLDSAPSRSKPDRGTVRTRAEVLNQRGETVMSVLALGMYRRRPTSGGIDQRL